MSIFRFAVFIFIVHATAFAWGQLPATRLGSVFPAGGNPGATLDLKIAGADLDDVAQLRFSHPGIRAKQKMAEPGPFDQGPQPVPNEFVVTIAGNVPVGLYEVRAVGKYGISNPRRFGVSKLAEVTETEPNQSRDTATVIELPVVVNGQLQATADVDYFSFTAKANERVLLDCYAFRMDSRMDAVIVVYDASGREVANCRDGQNADPLVDFQASAGQTYTIRVYDATYQGGADFAYRLFAGALPHVDYVFPPAGQGGGNRPFTIYGRNLAGGQPAGTTYDGKSLQKLNVNIGLPNGSTPDLTGAYVEPAGAGLDGISYQWNSPQGPSNPVFVGVATAPPIVEAEPNDEAAKAQQVTVPGEIMGQFYPRRDADWFQFEAQEGEAITLEVISQRTGIPTNPSLMLEQIIPATEDKTESTKQIAFVTESGDLDSGSEFDTRNQDPVFEFAVPATGAYRVLLRDSNNALRADPRHTYRLAIRRAQPDFRLVAVPEVSYNAVVLRKGGQAAVRIVAFRRDGFIGVITVTAQGLTAGVSSRNALLGPSRHSAMLTLAAATNANPATAAIKIVGTGQVNGANVSRDARLAAAINELPVRQNNNNARPTSDSRLVNSLVVTVSDEVAPVRIVTGGGQVWETSRAGIVKIPFERVGDFKGKVTLFPRSLPANVTVAQLTINPNTNKGEHEIKLNAKTEVGTYTFNFDGIAEQVDYVHNPEAAAAAAARKKEVDAIAAEAAAQAKAAADAIRYWSMLPPR